MKKTLAWLLLTALLLCGCGKSAEENKGSAGAETVSGVDAKSGAWIGQGGCFQLSSADVPNNCELSFPYKGERCCLIQGYMENSLWLGDRELCRLDGMIGGADADETGIWYCIEGRADDGRMTEKLIRLSDTGEEQEHLDLSFPKDCFPRSFAVTADGFYFNCSDRLRILDRSAALLWDIPHEEWRGKLVKGSDGTVFFVDEQKTGGGSVSRINLQTGTMEPLFEYPRGSICRGDGESALLLMLPDGIYRLSDSGETVPLVIWEECGLALSGLRAVESVGDGSYILRGFSFEPLLLSPADPSELKPRVRVQLAMMGQYGNLPSAVAAFNARSTDCCVELVDLKEGGLSDEDALTRLNTRIIAGEGPDMLVFGPALSPFPYLRKGMLRDLEAELSAAGTIDPQDLLIAGPVKRDCGGLYVLSSDFSMETRLGLRETFGDVKGWSFDEYLALARSTPSDRMVMYNLTRDYFLTEGASRFLRRAINWQEGSCDLDNPDFIKLLEAVRDLIETPEDPNNMVFGSNLMADGFMATELVMINQTESLARECRHVGKPVSIIGFPTPDGSCGTDMKLLPVGVLKSSEHPEACLAFLTDWLQHPTGLPAYRPLFDEALSEAMRPAPDDTDDPFSQRLDPPLTEQEAQRLRELIAAVEHTTLYDETALDIVREEIAAFLTGQRSAEETAHLIQSRVSLYVSEQT